MFRFKYKGRARTICTVLRPVSEISWKLERRGQRPAGCCFTIYPWRRGDRWKKQRRKKVPHGGTARSDQFVIIGRRCVQRNTIIMTRQRREAARLIGLPFSPRNLFGETIFHGRTVITAPIPIATRDYIEPKRALYLSPFIPLSASRLEMPCRLFYSEESELDLRRIVVSVRVVD